MKSCWSLVIDSNGWDVCMTAFIFVKVTLLFFISVLDLLVQTYTYTI